MVIQALDRLDIIIGLFIILVGNSNGFISGVILAVIAVTVLFEGKIDAWWHHG
jgi:hypothetical protein